MPSTIPHPIPYQGSKRALAPLILRHMPARCRRFYEPFAGSAAVSLAMAHENRAEAFVVSDVYAPLINLWRAILHGPTVLARAYERLWLQGEIDPAATYLAVRERFNRSPSPSALLYLLARCTKNSVRFNRQGAFNQAADPRRLGTRPETMATNLLATSRLLGWRTHLHALDYEDVITLATPDDAVYLDPPYQGTSHGKDHRYAQSIDLERFVGVLEGLRRRAVPFAVSFDGRTGDKHHGTRLPRELGLERMALRAGRSAQATLLGRAEETVESLYLSPELVGGRGREGRRST